MIDLARIFLAELVGLFLQMAPYLLLGFTVAGVLNAFIDKRFVARHVGSTGFGSIVKAAAFGVPLPLCSCAVVPAGVSLKRSGASTPATLSFLISTPQTGIDSIVATYGLLGPLFAVFRPLAALLNGIAGGLVSRMVDRAAGPARSVTPPPVSRQAALHARPSIMSRLGRFYRHAYVESVDAIAVQFLIGIVIASAIGLLLPADFFEGRAIGTGLPAMLLMVAVGVPMYICATSSIPIALALLAKGIEPGAAYAFLVAGPATNAATIAILVGLIGRRQTTAFVASVVVGSLAFGAILNEVASAVGWTAPDAGAGAFHAEEVTTQGIVLSTALALLLGASLVRRARRRLASGSTRLEPPSGGTPTTGIERASTAASGSDSSRGDAPDTRGTAAVAALALGVQGMTCDCCVRSVEEAVSELGGVEAVQVSLRDGRVLVRGSADREQIAGAIRAAGYEVEAR